MPRTHQGTPVDWLAGFCAHRGASLAMAAAVAMTDRGLPKRRRSFVRRALVDEPCHLATTMIVLGTLTRWRGRSPSGWFTGAMLSSSVLIDLDHLPRQFGSDILAAGMPRPATHALWAMGTAAAAAAVAGRRYQVSGSGGARIVTGITAGAAWGLGAHFLRDVGTGPIALGWPLSRASVRLPNSCYLAALPVLATLPLRRPARPVSLGCLIHTETWAGSSDRRTTSASSARAATERTLRPDRSGNVTGRHAPASRRRSRAGLPVLCVVLLPAFVAGRRWARAGHAHLLAGVGGAQPQRRSCA